ncbi:hypothetical protein CYY_000827 [Polysphondylium violaceum]|uniref:C2 domain-containing protein n=1 Tax=Polysphondylium violaceum TaxID=133409 RepID=A0A8J4V234_9MYCE|nr:hypothetical protein CYY_000827 [Polysphondylium violaceum]
MTTEEEYTGPFAHLAPKDRLKKKIKPTKNYDLHEVFRITVLNGIVKKSTDSNGKSDPYVRVSKKGKFGSKKTLFTTSVCKKTLTPSWNEWDNFILSPKNKELIFELWDQDTFTKDDLIGTYHFLPSLPYDMFSNWEFKLNDEVTATIQFIITDYYHPDSDK